MDNEKLKQFMIIGGFCMGALALYKIAQLEKTLTYATGALDAVNTLLGKTPV